MIVRIGDKPLDLDDIDTKLVADHVFSEDDLREIAKHFVPSESLDVYQQPLGKIFQIKHDIYMRRVTEIETYRKRVAESRELKTIDIGNLVHMQFELEAFNEHIQPYKKIARQVKSIILYSLFGKLGNACDMTIYMIRDTLCHYQNSIYQSSVNLVKLPNFPSFDTWLNDHDCKYLISHGDYYIAISRTGWSKKEALFHFAVSTQSNPLNIHSSVIFDKVTHIDTTHDEDWFNEELERWYDTTISKFNKFWIDYIERTYLNERSTNNAGDKNT